MAPGNSERHRSIPTIIGEIRRFGVRKCFDRRDVYALWSASVVLALAVPGGQREHLPTIISAQLTFLGFSLTIFGFVILGGKDDFFDPVLRSGPGGQNALRNLVLHLFWPIIWHGLACVAGVAYLLFGDAMGFQPILYMWRLTYAFLTLFSFLESFYATRILFILAVRRLIWRIDISARERERAQWRRSRGIVIPQTRHKKFRHRRG